MLNKKAMLPICKFFFADLNKLHQKDLQMWLPYIHQGPTRYLVATMEYILILRYAHLFYQTRPVPWPYCEQV